MATDGYPAAGDWFVLVAGWPGSGKSTLAAALATELGRAAVLAMLRVAVGCPGAVLDSA